MEKRLILLTPEFFFPNNPLKAQFDDVPSDDSPSDDKAHEHCSLFLVPPTLEGLSLLPGPTGNKECSGRGVASRESLAVIPFSEQAEHQKPKQLLPFKQNFASSNGVPLNSSYLSICQAQIPLGM